MNKAQQIEMNGHRALVADHCALCDQVANLTARVEQLEFLMSEEIMARLAAPAGSREVVEEWGGWRVERQFVHSPGDPEDES